MFSLRKAHAKKDETVSPFRSLATSLAYLEDLHAYLVGQNVLEDIVQTVDLRSLNSAVSLHRALFFCLLKLIEIVEKVVVVFMRDRRHGECAKHILVGVKKLGVCIGRVRFDEFGEAIRLRGRNQI